jgi:hypothetical protein
MEVKPLLPKPKLRPKGAITLQPVSTRRGIKLGFMESKILMQKSARHLSALRFLLPNHLLSSCLKTINFAQWQ